LNIPVRPAEGAAIAAASAPISASAPVKAAPVAVAEAAPVRS
jgi:hypothetical protein